MEFRLLGPFEARHGGAVITVGRRRQERCLLGILLLEAGGAVPIARLIDLLWDGEPPENARAAVHTYVGRLRTALAPYGVEIRTRAGGYAVPAEGVRVDVRRFAELSGTAAGEPSAVVRVRLLDEALGLWRGPLLADVAGERLRRRLGTGYAERRLSAVELRAESRLALAEPDVVAAELAPLAVAHPTRERLVAAYMTALHRCGRHADALAVYRDTRDRLAHDLGIEPGAELRDLHRGILRGEPARSPTPPRFAVRVRERWLPWAVGGHPALEFCNTYAGWGGEPAPRGDWLSDYAALAVWTEYTGLAAETTVTKLLDAAAAEPEEADAVLEKARDLRAHLYRCLVDHADRDAFEAVAGYVTEATREAEFVRGEDGLGRWVLPPGAGLVLPLHAAARAAADLLADPRRFTVRACPGRHCGWLFLDADGRRRWCAMAACGAGNRCDPVG